MAGCLWLKSEVDEWLLESWKVCSRIHVLRASVLREKLLSVAETFAVANL